ncbi:copper resistance CopC family protein [Nocardioides sp.]|uniref:copper resistance CopC family protein n=1 Tax=Nocardioides sp. TaxID=35761 RepID=UPI002623A43A|nr:copper resistance CopC family protein [Nocardioides sp.]
MRAPVHRRVLAALAVVLGLAALTALAAVPAAPAFAHTSLVSATPAQGAVLAALPARIELTFASEMKAPASLVATAPDGTSVLAGDITVAGRTVSARLTPSTQQGTYSYAFRAFSVDGHQVTGQVTFTVGAATSSGSASPSASAAATATSTATGSPSPSATASSTTTDTAAATTTGGSSFWSRHWWQVLVALALFGSAGILELLLRRTQTGTASSRE